MVNYIEMEQCKTISYELLNYYNDNVQILENVSILEFLKNTNRRSYPALVEVMDSIMRLRGYGIKSYRDGDVRMFKI
jgi:hypothetical protein